MLVKGDKIKLVAPMGVFTNVGEICDVIDISDTGVITFKFGNGMHMGMMSADEFNKYFEKYEEPKYEECCDCDCNCDCDECCERDENYEHLLDIMDNAEYTAFKVFDRCVVVACKLPNGFIIVESSACVDPDDYDVNYAIENCIDRIENKVRTMEAYKRCDEMNWFEEDYENEDNCTSNDLDCDDCDDEDCPYCTNNNH